MAEQAQARMLSAAFPTPPPFYKHFTKQNVSKLRELRKEASKNKDVGSEESERTEIDVLSLPSELRYLVPPEPPVDGRFRSFGHELDLAQSSQTLEAAGIQQLYPAEAVEGDQMDPSPHLITLTRSVLCNVLEMFGTLSRNPTQAPEKIEDISTIYFNINDLLNRYRDHQARETVILMHEEKIEEIRANNARIKEEKAKLAIRLKELQDLSSLPAAAPETLADRAKPSPDQVASDVADEARRDAQRTMWDALEAELGD